MIEMLLLKGAYPNLGDKRDGSTPLHYASTKGFKEVVRMLLEAGATPNMTLTNFTHETPLHQASRHGHDDVGQTLLSHKKTDPDAENVYGETPLHVASHKGHKGVVQVLLDGGACPTIENTDGENPMYRAARAGHKEVFKVLLDFMTRPPRSGASRRKRKRPCS